MKKKSLTFVPVLALAYGLRHALRQDDTSDDVVTGILNKNIGTESWYYNKLYIKKDPPNLPCTGAN